MEPKPFPEKLEPWCCWSPSRSHAQSENERREEDLGYMRVIPGLEQCYRLILNFVELHLHIEGWAR